MHAGKIGSLGAKAILLARLGIDKAEVYDELLHR